MSTHIIIDPRETRKINLFDSRQNLKNVGELLILIDFDELILKNIELEYDRFDLFTFILEENNLMDSSNLVYFNNRSDKRNIIIEKDNLELDNSLLTVGHDFAIELNLNNLVEHSEKIVLYFEFLNVRAKRKGYFKSLFQTDKVINHNSLFKGNITFSIANIKDGLCYLMGTMSEFSLLNKLVTIKKVGQHDIEVEFNSEVIQVEMSEVIDKYLITNNANSK